MNCSGDSRPERRPRPPRDLAALFQEYHRTRDLSLRNELVLRHENLARHLASRFAATGGAATEDLVQVAYIGLIGAIERFDPEAGRSFSAFAVPTVVGVIKHYLRDQTWFLRAPRRLRELSTCIRRLKGPLEQRLGRPPTITDLAQATGVSEELVVEAMEVDLIYRPASLDACSHEVEGEPWWTFHEALGRTDPAYRLIEENEALRTALQELDERERAIIRSRFFSDASQSQVASQLGISQMHVSRLERRALERLRSLLS
jgi:RNA polymerase sigma-B factor